MVANRAPDALGESRIARLVAPRRFELGTQTPGDPGPGHVRVRILACGVCSSELHSAQETHPSYPLTMGHEPVGVVDSVGDGVKVYPLARG
jgi:propanol-preferring alcohol dehydrogenase